MQTVNYYRESKVYGTSLQPLRHEGTSNDELLFISCNTQKKMYYEYEEQEGHPFMFRNLTESN